MIETFKVKITKASRDTYWYANKIGKVYEVFYEPKGMPTFNVLVYDQQQLTIFEEDYEKLN